MTQREWEWKVVAISLGAISVMMAVVIGLVIYFSPQGDEDNPTSATVAVTGDTGEREMGASVIEPRLVVNPKMGTVTVILSTDLHVRSMLVDGNASLYILATGGRGYNIVVSTDVRCPDGVMVGARYDDAKQIVVSYVGESTVPLEPGLTHIILQGKEEPCG